MGGFKIIMVWCALFAPDKLFKLLKIHHRSCWIFFRDLVMDLIHHSRYGTSILGKINCSLKNTLLLLLSELKLLLTKPWTMPCKSSVECIYHNKGVLNTQVLMVYVLFRMTKNLFEIFGCVNIKTYFLTYID